MQASQLFPANNIHLLNFTNVFPSAILTVYLVAHYIIELLYKEFIIIVVCYFNPRVTGNVVALKEIRLNSAEGTPFTAIREGDNHYTSTLLW